MSRLLAAGSVAALLATAGCGDDAAAEKPAAPAPQGSSAAPAAPAGQPLITEAEVTAVVGRITEANNKANAALDPKLLDSYEIEASAATDEAALQIHRGGDIKPFTYEAQGSRIPSDAGGVDWFVAETQTGGGDNWPLVLTKAGGQDWKITHAVPLPVSIPDSKKDAAGNAEVVAADDPGQTLIASPQDVAKAHAESIASDGAPSGLFAGDTETGKTVRKEDALGVIKFSKGGQTMPGKNQAVTAEVAPYPVRALRTADGGALVAYSTLTELSAEAAGGKVIVNPLYLKLGKPGTGKATLTTLHMWWVLVPAKGAGQTVTVLGGTNQLVKLS